MAIQRKNTKMQKKICLFRHNAKVAFIKDHLDERWSFFNFLAIFLPAPAQISFFSSRKVHRWQDRWKEQKGEDRLPKIHIADVRECVRMLLFFFRARVEKWFYLIIYVGKFTKRKTRNADFLCILRSSSGIIKKDKEVLKGVDKL